MRQFCGYHLPDEAAGLYYYANAAGVAVCEPAFTDCTDVRDGTALVKIDGTMYTLVIGSAS